MIHVIDYSESICKHLKETIVTDKDGIKIDLDTGMEHWCQITRKIHKNNKTMFFTGNGASAMMASHMAADASKNGEFRSLAFNDPALLTAVSNDISYEESFAIPLERFSTPGDVLVTISSSGNSRNIIRALEKARDSELQRITLSGFKPNNISRQLGDLNFFVPADTYGSVEVAHQLLLHCWLDKYIIEYK